VLANVLRTDMGMHRPLPADSELAQAVAVLARAQQDAVWDRTTTANGQVAFGIYLWDDAAGAYVSGGLDVLTLLDGCVAEIVAFLTADLTRFGLPARIRP